MMNIKLATDNRKEAAVRLAEITGAESRYTKVPRCAYEVGPYTIEKDGSITVAEDADLAPLQALADEGLVEPFEAPATEPAAEEAEAEPINLTVEVPMKHHNGATLRNLINLIYTRAGLLNKALGTGFRVDEELIEALKDDACTLTTESLLQAIRDFEAEHGKAIDGLTFTPEGITFSSLPETTDAEKLRTFTILAGMMNKQALDQKRIQAKAVNDENEKYALRIWLTRLGMNGSEFKEARKVLMANLTGHCAFRTPAEEAKWKARQAEKREALKAAKAETAAEEQEEVEMA
jgi:hypothetical protein